MNSLLSTIRKSLKIVIMLFFIAWLPVRSIAQSKKIRNIVIVHGAFADGSGWQEVFKILTRRGYHVTIVQNPLTSFEDDVAATVRALYRQDGPVILVGHSYGGSVITQAGISSKVARLVYVAAFVPDVGETTLSLGRSVAPAPENGILPPDENGFVYYDESKFHVGFVSEQTSQQARFMYASQVPVSAKALITPLTSAAWKTKPSYGIVATEDKIIDPGVERTMYKRAGAKTTEIKGGHTLYMSNAKAVANVIAKAAKGR